MCSSSPARTPKLQLALINHQQENVGSHQKKDTPCPRAKEKPQQDGRRGKIAFRIKPHNRQRVSEGSNKTLCAPGPRDPTETEPHLRLSVSCGGMGLQWPAAGAGTLCAAGLYHTACAICPLGGGHH